MTAVDNVNDKKAHYYLITFVFRRYRNDDKIVYKSRYLSTNNPFVSSSDILKAKIELICYLADKNIPLDDSDVEITCISNMGYMTKDEFEGVED